jgi:hypothetical protein
LAIFCTLTKARTPERPIGFRSAVPSLPDPVWLAENKKGTCIAARGFDQTGRIDSDILGKEGIFGLATAFAVSPESLTASIPIPTTNTKKVITRTVFIFFLPGIKTESGTRLSPESA